MKNIHVLPTDKPSRLADMEGLLVFGNDLKSPVGHPTMFLYRHIYITNDSEIKVGDWCFDINGKIFKHENHFPISIGQRKIILTTDQDLIKDGVQAIDDEFLKWFVKNPSCDFVEVEGSCLDETAFIHNIITYKIIIPQEEPKQECPHPEQGKEYYRDGCFKCWQCGKIVVSNSNEPKQETLEEAAENFVNSTRLRNYKVLFIEGAKWQADRMYSEEEVSMILQEFKRYLSFGDEIPESEWFEQFKKK